MFNDGMRLLLKWMLGAIFFFLIRAAHRPPGKPPTGNSPRILIGYVRLSYARTEAERGQVLRPEPDAHGKPTPSSQPDPAAYHAAGTSIDRQRENIRKLAEREGYEVEIYEDVGGHRSGRSTDHRPGWQSAENRLPDPDVAGLIVNELSRAHRKSVRLLELLERLERLNKRLYLADPERRFYGDLGLTSILIKIIAILDEWYTEDNAQRQRSRARYRAERGLTNGMPPFGTYRRADGTLAPSRRGAWWLAEWGQFVAGIPDEPPHPDAVWRLYAATAERILQLYGPEKTSYRDTAAQLNAEGYPFQNRVGQPRPVTADDVRRVVHNWSTYGGLVGGGRSALQTDPAYAAPIAAMQLDPARCVFPEAVLRAVARRQLHHQTVYGDRRQPTGLEHGVIHTSDCYPLRGVLCCQHCLASAAAGTTPPVRAWLGGTQQRGMRRYRHRAGDPCPSRSRSVSALTVEQQVGDLLARTRLRSEVLASLQQRTSQLAALLRHFTQATRQQADQDRIDQLTRRLRTLHECYATADVSEADYQRRQAELRSQLAALQQPPDPAESGKLGLPAVLAALNDLGGLWQRASLAQQEKLVQLLFTRIHYDLDHERITQVDLQPAFRWLLVLPPLPL